MEVKLLWIGLLIRSSNASLLVVYIVVGATHRHVIQNEGETYRLSLQWLVIYHGAKHNAAGPIYRLGLALFDLNEPERCLKRGKEWVFGPPGTL